MRSIGNLLISMQSQIPGKNVVWLYDLSVILTSSQHRSEVLTEHSNMASSSTEGGSLAVAGPSREGVSLTCGNIKPSNPTRKFQPPQRRRRNKAYSGERFGRSTSAHTSVFLEAIFSRNGRKIHKILRRIIQAWYRLESTAIIIIIIINYYYYYCLDGKRNNRNSTGWRYLCIQWRKVEFPVAHEKLKFRAQNAHAQLTNWPLKYSFWCKLAVAARSLVDSPKQYLILHRGKKEARKQ